MVDWLKEAGYESRIADPGVNAIVEIQKEIPNLVILDWGYPNSNCLQIIQTVREQEKGSHMLILVTAAKMREEDVLAYLEAGADICLTESLHPKVFVARVHSVFRRTK
jgi:two-component system phosphate regulon response regulator PhoB